MKEMLLKSTSMITAIAGIITVTIFLREFAFVENPDKKSEYLIILMTVVAATVVAQFYFTFIKNRSDLSIAYNVSIFGFPKSGKTTFITTLFSMIMYRKLDLQGFKPLIKGKSTIEKINNYIKQLEKGKPIQSTTDQSLFAYRINLESIKKSFLTNKNYKVEIGDFPGEHSLEFIDEKNNHFITESDYFNWAKDADAFIFVIDLGSYLLNRVEYTAEISSAIRSAWQNLLEINSNNIEKFRKKPTLLLLNKVDLFDLNLSKQTSQRTQEILNAAFSKTNSLPTERDIENSDEYLYFQDEVKNDFSNLINFFEAESNTFDLAFMSSFAKKDKRKIGFQKLVNHILPKK